MTNTHRRFLIDRLNDCEDLKRALGRTGPGDEEALDNLIDAFNRQLRVGAKLGLDLGITIEVDDLREVVPPLAYVIDKLEAALERLGDTP
jgi:hypothetical protein